MAGIIASAAQPAPYNPATGTTGLDAQGTVGSAVTAAPTANTATAAQAAPSTYTPTQLGAQTNWTVGSDQTVQGQLKGLTNYDNPLNQGIIANTQAQANDRGMLNSSMAATAGQSAVLQNALPIATADAQTFAKAAGYNADTANTFTQKNADIANTAAGFNAQQTQQSAQFDASTQNQTQQFNAQQQNQNQQFNNQQAQQNAQFNAGQGNATTLANIEAGYKTLMQTNQSAATLMQQFTTNMTNIQNNDKLGVDAKNFALQQQQVALKDGMEVLGSLQNLNLGDLLKFDTPAGATPANPQAVPAGTTPGATPTANGVLTAIQNGFRNQGHR